MNDLRAHVAFFAVAVIATLLTWNRDTSGAADRDLPVVWERDTTDVLGVHYRTPTLDLRVERRSDDDGAFLWGNQTRAGLASLEFPVGAEGHALLTVLSVLQVERELGQLSDERKTRYGLVDSGHLLSVRFDDGQRELVVGDSVFGSGDRYALESATGVGYVLSRHLIGVLEGGDGALRERVAHHFAPVDIGAVRISGPAGERRMARTEEGDWTEIDGGSPDTGFGNFMERVGLLSVGEGYADPPSPGDLTLILRMDYVSVDAEPLGFFELLHDGGSPLKTYFLVSETTRIPGRVPRLLAERVEQAVADLY